MTPEQLADAIRGVVDALVAEGAISGPVPQEIVVERPRQKEHGDYATPVALTLAKSAGRPPREIAALVSDRLAAVPGSPPPRSPDPASSTSASRPTPRAGWRATS